MAKEIMTTNRAVAEAVKLAKPQVVSSNYHIRIPCTIRCRW